MQRGSSGCHEGKTQKLVKLTAAAPPAAIDEARSRSGGDAGGSSWSRATTLNLVLGHFVVSTEASAEDLQWLFETTSAHIVVVTYATGGPIDKTTSIAVAM